MPDLPDDKPRDIESIFQAALETGEAGRAALLDRLCGARPALRAEVDSLLVAHGRAEAVMPSAGAKALAKLAERALRDLEASAEFRPGAHIAHYRLEARLGAGGMGEVFRARDLALDRPAAIKVVPPGFDPELTRRLLREVEASARLQHPAIATFFEGGEDNGRAYFAMELVEGDTLRHRLEQGSMAPREALRIVAALLEALAHAHAAGILHRDIKPDNIMLGPDGAPKLLDFGLARALTSDEADVIGDAVTSITDRTAHSAVLGTPGYMSPEQIRAEPVGVTSDLFQVGAVLYEMLAGHRAFGGGPVFKRIATTLAGPPDLSPLLALAPSGLAPLVSRALAADPADRFGSAGEFLLALELLDEANARATLPNSLAVLPFTNTSGDIEHDWLDVGLSDRLRQDLVRIHGLAVAPRPATMGAIARMQQRGHPSRPADVALGLGLRWVVTGTHARTGDDLEVSVQLTEASTGRVIYAEALRGSVGRLFDLQDRIASACSQPLHTDRDTVSRARIVGNARAFELHTKAQQIWHAGKRDPRIIPLLEEAVAEAPDYVPALSTLVAVFATRFIVTADPADLDRAIAMSDRVIALDPNNTEAWTWRGYSLYRLDRIAEAQVAAQRAVEVGREDPIANYAYGALLQDIGRTDEALHPLQQSVRLEPQLGIGWLALGWTFHTFTRYPEARFAFTRAQALEGLPGPTFLQGVGGYLAECLRCEGRLDDARTEALAGVESIERSDNLYRDTIRAFCLGALGRTALDRHDRDAARAAFSQAIAQMRGRTRTQGGGHVLVQALAGLARADADPSVLEEALSLFIARTGHSFKTFFGCHDWFTLLELARSADQLGRVGDAQALYDRAVAAGCRAPLVPV